MSPDEDGLRQSYEIHGVTLAVCSPDRVVAAALDHRLRTFRSPPSEPADLTLELAVADERPKMEPPVGAGRPLYDAAEGQILYYPQQDTLQGELEGVRLTCDMRIGLARIQSAELAGRTLYLASHPLATICLIELLKRHGRFAMHTACLALGGRGVLLAGPSGVGKSTLALALARAGLAFLADDTAFLKRDGARVEVLGFPDAVGIRAHGGESPVAPYPLSPVTDARAARSDRVMAPAQTAVLALPQPGFPKRLVRIDELLGVTVSLACEPAAIVFPSIVGAPQSRLRRLDAKEAWIRLVPDILLTEPAATQAHLDVIADLLGQVSCYGLQSGADIEHSVELLTGII